MPRYRLFILLMLIVPLLTSLVFAKKQQKVEHVPLPAKVLQGKTIFIDNQSGWSEMADKAYSTLKGWGRYQIVDAKEKADLIVILSVIEAQEDGNQSSWVSTYNTKTGVWTHGTVSTPTMSTVRFSEIKLIDRISGDPLWSDRKEWSKKHSATQVLIESLRQRVEEQEKQSTQQ